LQVKIARWKQVIGGIGLTDCSLRQSVLHIDAHIAHIEVGEIATVLDLRFADGTVAGYGSRGSTSMRQTRVGGQLQ